MKNMYRNLYSIILIILILSGCKKDNPQPSPGDAGPAPPAITANVDGTEWKSYSNKSKV